MRTTLLLNASYEPLCVIPVNRAVVLVLQEKADIISEGDSKIRSSSRVVATPSVIRLRYYVRVPYRTTLALNRRNLIARDKGRCVYCKAKGDLTIDHVIPRSRGGENVWENVVAACKPCNNKKDSKLLSELGWKLPFKPTAPHGWSWLVVGVAVPDPAWEPWLSPAGHTALSTI